MPEKGCSLKEEYQKLQKVKFTYETLLEFIQQKKTKKLVIS